jgi:hypothetical protein
MPVSRVHAGSSREWPRMKLQAIFIHTDPVGHMLMSLTSHQTHQCSVQTHSQKGHPYFTL